MTPSERKVAYGYEDSRGRRNHVAQHQIMNFFAYLG